MNAGVSVIGLDIHSPTGARSLIAPRAATVLDFRRAFMLHGSGTREPLRPAGTSSCERAPVPQLLHETLKVVSPPGIALVLIEGGTRR